MRLVACLLAFLSFTCKTDEPIVGCEEGTTLVGSVCQPVPRCGPGTTLKEGICTIVAPAAEALPETEDRRGEVPAHAVDGAKRLEQRDTPAILEMPSAELPFELPKKPSRDDIRGGIKVIYSAVARCGDKHGGRGTTVKVRFRIGGDGTIETAEVVNEDGEGPLRACVVRAVKQARFPKTEKGVTVTYPFLFR